MKTKKWLILSVILLIIAIAFGGFFVGKSILALKKSNKQAITKQKSTENITTNAFVKNNENKGLRVQNYFPSKTIKMYFSGGFENGGYTNIIDKIDKDKVQLKSLNTGSGGIAIYQISENDIRLIFRREVPDQNFEENYIETFKPNTDEIILKAPLEVGTKWTDNADGKYKITGINVSTKTPAGTFSAIEVTFLRGDFEVKIYYAKDLGVVKTSSIGNESELIKVE